MTKSGTAHFRRQRLTALANVPLSICGIAAVVMLPRADYDALTAFLAAPPVAALLALFIVSFVWHMRLGLQMVLEDYVQSSALLRAALFANNAVAFLIGLICLAALGDIAGLFNVIGGAS